MGMGKGKLKKTQLLKQVKYFNQCKINTLNKLFLEQSEISCELGYSSICKSNVSNEEKTAICPATNMVG